MPYWCTVLSIKTLLRVVVLLKIRSLPQLQRAVCEKWECYDISCRASHLVTSARPLGRTYRVSSTREKDRQRNLMPTICAPNLSDKLTNNQKAEPPRGWVLLLSSMLNEINSNSVPNATGPLPVVPRLGLFLQINLAFASIMLGNAQRERSNLLLCLTRAVKRLPWITAS